MKSFYRWLAAHSALCRFAVLIGLTAFTFWAASFPYVPFLGVYLADLVLWVLLSRLIMEAPAKLLREPEELMNQQCDPRPFLDETKRQLSTHVSGPQQQLNEINYAAALRAMGENYKAAEILENINIDRFPGITPYLKFTYYNNLADVLFALDRTTEGLIWHRKAAMIFRDLPETKIKQQHTDVHGVSQAESLYYQKEYAQALHKVAQVRCESNRVLLDAALLAAKCHIALEEPEKAREKLQYVANHGNQLYIVKEAQSILETLETE